MTRRARRRGARQYRGNRRLERPGNRLESERRQRGAQHRRGGQHGVHGRRFPERRRGCALADRRAHLFVNIRYNFPRAGFAALGWEGLVAPAGIAPAIAQTLYEETTRIFAAPATRQSLFTQGFELPTATSEEFDRFYLQEIAKWAKVIKAGNIRFEP